MRIEPYASQAYVPNYDMVSIPDQHEATGSRVEMRITGWSMHDTISFAPAQYDLHIPANRMSPASEDKMVSNVANFSAAGKRFDAQNTGLRGMERVHLDTAELHHMVQHIDRESKRVEHCHEMLGLLKV